MCDREAFLATAERVVREGEALVARQKALVHTLAAHGHAHQAAKAQKLLEAFETSLDLARVHLDTLRKTQRVAP